MPDYKFAVVNVGYEDSHVYSIDLFSNYEAAQEFMRKDAKEMNEECMNILMVNDYGQEIVKCWHDFEIDMSDYPFNDTEEIDFNDTYISFGDNWCVCVGARYTDRWLILEA